MWRGILLVLAAVSAAAAHAENVKVVFKINSVIAADVAGLKRFNFGLTPNQVDEILRLTDGEINFGNVYYVEAPAAQSLPLRERPGFSGVIYPNVPPPAILPGFDSDTDLAGEWWIDQLRVKEAWQKATGQGVIIADCDAGFYHDEPDLKANMLLEHRYDLSNPAAPDVVNDGPYAFHGTAVSAIMAGVQNVAGTNGIAYDAKIVPLQNFNYDEKDTLDKEEATAACVLRAINTPGVKIIVLENQTATGSSETFVGTRDAVRLAIRSGIAVIGAGGNYTVELTDEKTDDTGSIIVGALAQNDQAANFSNYGERVTVAAYGENLRTLYGPNGAFGDFGGTSGATPQVAAAVAMMLEAQPFLTPEKVRELLQQTREITALNQKVGGKLNVLAAVEAAIATTPNPAAWAEKEAFRLQLQNILAPSF